MSDIEVDKKAGNINSGIQFGGYGYSTDQNDVGTATGGWGPWRGEYSYDPMKDRTTVVVGVGQTIATPDRSLSIKYGAMVGVDTDGNQVLKLGAKAEISPNLNPSGTPVGPTLAYGGTVTVRTPIVSYDPASLREPTTDGTIATPQGPLRTSHLPNPVYSPIDDPYGPFSPNIRERLPDEFDRIADKLSPEEKDRLRDQYEDARLNGISREQFKNAIKEGAKLDGPEKLSGNDGAGSGASGGGKGGGTTASNNNGGWSNGNGTGPRDDNSGSGGTSASAPKSGTANKSATSHPNVKTSNPSAASKTYHVEDMDKETGNVKGYTATKNTNTGKAGPRPVLLDLDGNGVQITELSRSNTFLDSADDGLLHRTAWAGAGDGVLFFDVGDDGKISETREYVFTEWDPTAPVIWRPSARCLTAMAMAS